MTEEEDAYVPTEFDLNEASNESIKVRTSAQDDIYIYSLFMLVVKVI